MTPTDDDNLLAELTRTLRAVDPIPDRVRIAARAAIEWRTIDAELAELVSDSVVDEPLLAVRGTAQPRMLAFEAGDLTIELEAEPNDEDGLRLVGQLIPPHAAQIVVRHGDELVATTADERGRFVADGVQAGRVSLRCRLDAMTGDGRLVETAWLSI